MADKQIISLPQLPNHIYAVDTHCHLDMIDYERDCAKVISSAEQVNVNRLITIGIDLVSSQKAVKLSEQHQAVFASVGVHPHNVKVCSKSYYKKIIDLTAHPKVVAYGEIGLDFVKKHAPVNLQIIHSKRQISIAKGLNLPLILHDRGAHEMMTTVLKEERPFPAGGVMHCFSGDKNLARTILNLGFHISIPGIVTYNKAEEMQKVVKNIPLSSLLLETDAPFLAPVPRRGSRNEPSYLLYSAQKIADLRKTALEKIIQQTTKNAEFLFSLIPNATQK